MTKSTRYSIKTSHPRCLLSICVIDCVTRNVHSEIWSSIYRFEYKCFALLFNDIKIRSKYPNVPSHKSRQFKPNTLAKYALACLKKVKKVHLIYTDFKNIETNLKVSSMNFLIDSRYQYTEPISDDAWKELICVRKLIDHTSYKSIVIVFFF